MNIWQSGSNQYFTVNVHLFPSEGNNEEAGLNPDFQILPVSFSFGKIVISTDFCPVQIQQEFHPIQMKDVCQHVFNIHLLTIKY